MRLFEVQKLLEYKREITAKRMGKNILSGLQKDNIFSNKVNELTQEEQINAVLDKLEDMDPTKNKQFVQWLAKQYGSFRIEDGGRVKDALTNFVKLKTQIKRQDKSVDINSYSWHDFEQMIDDITKVDIDSEDTNYDIEDVKVLYNGPYGKLLIPETKEASCQIGAGTKWCTAARDSNMFDYYKEKGPLFIWIDKSGDKYQFHFETKQYMDARDKVLSDDKIKYFITEHPVLSKFLKKFMNKDPYLIKYIKNPDKDVQMAAVQQNGYAIEFIENPYKDVQMAAVQLHGYAIEFIENPDKDVQMAAVQQNGLAIRDIIEKGIDPDKDVQMSAVQQYNYILRVIKNPDKDVQMAAVKQDGSVIIYIKNPDKDVQMAAVQQNGSVIQFIDNPDKDVQMAAVQENIDAIAHIKNPHPEVVEYVNKNKRL